MDGKGQYLPFSSILQISIWRIMKIFNGFLVCLIILSVFAPETLPGSSAEYVHFRLKAGGEYDAVVDSVFWWGMKFQDKQAVMYKQLATLETTSEALMAEIKDIQPAVMVESKQHGFTLHFENITAFDKPVNNSRFFRRNYLLVNVMTETGEPFEFQLFSVPNDAPFLISMMATSGGFTYKDASTYADEVDLPTEKDLRHLVFGYTFGFGYRHAFSRSDLSVIPAFSKKVDAVTQEGYIVEEVTDVAFFLDLKYRHVFRSNLLVSAGTRIYFHTIPVQRIGSGIHANIGIGWMFGR